MASDSDRKLTARQSSFVEYYADPKSETYNNATASAIKAGYKEDNAKVIAAQNLTKLNIKDAIASYKASITAENKITVEWLDKQLLEQYQSAVDKGDTTNAKGFLQLIGQRVAAYTDNINNTDTVAQEQAQARTAEERESLRRLAGLRLAEISKAG